MIIQGVIKEEVQIIRNLEVGVLPEIWCQRHRGMLGVDISAYIRAGIKASWRLKRNKVSRVKLFKRKLEVSTLKSGSSSPCLWSCSSA